MGEQFLESKTLSLKFNSRVVEDRLQIVFTFLKTILVWISLFSYCHLFTLVQNTWVHKGIYSGCLGAFRYQILGFCHVFL